MVNIQKINVAMHRRDKPIQNKACQDKHIGFLIKSMQLTESIAPLLKKTLKKWLL